MKPTDRDVQEIAKLRFQLDDDIVYVVDRRTGRVLCQIDPVQGGIDMRDPMLLLDPDRQMSWKTAAGESLRRGDFQEVQVQSSSSSTDD